jgi:hypothetical protein
MGSDHRVARAPCLSAHALRHAPVLVGQQHITYCPQPIQAGGGSAFTLAAVWVAGAESHTAPSLAWRQPCLAGGSSVEHVLMLGCI